MKFRAVFAAITAKTSFLEAPAVCCERYRKDCRLGVFGPMEQARNPNLVDPAIYNPDQEFLGTKGLVFIGEEVLAYWRSDDAPSHAGELDVPGGAREGTESPYETFRREVEEEFGLVITRDTIVAGRGYVSSGGEFNGVGYYLVACLDASAKDAIRFGDEGRGYVLMALQEFLARDDAWPAYQKRARDYAVAAGIIPD